MQKIQSFISLIYLFLLTLRHTMKANVHIPNKQTACVSFSEQADVKSTPSEVGSPILCGKTFEKEGKKCAENLEVSDFLLNTHTQSRRIITDTRARVIYHIIVIYNLFPQIGNNFFLRIFVCLIPHSSNHVLAIRCRA